VQVDTVVKVSRAYAQRGGDVQATISRKKRATPPVAPTVTGEVEARLVALACSAPPPGDDRWSLRLLEKHVVLIDDLPNLDHSTIGRVLKKRTSPSSEGLLDHSAEGQRCLRCGDGGRLGRLRPPLESGAPGGVHG
jgi:hypothetical protein